MSQKQLVRKLTISGICLALSVVLRVYSIMLPISGVSGLRIGLSVIFIAIPAILFGPWWGSLWGGAVAGACDFLGWALKPLGAYIPWLTLTAVAEGVFIALLWYLLQKLSPRLLKGLLLGAFGLLGLFGLGNMFALQRFPASPWAQFISGVSANQSGFVTYIPLLVSLAGFLFLLAYALFIEKMVSSSFRQGFIKLLFTLTVSGALVSTANTFILLYSFHIQKAFFLFFAPRMTASVLTSVTAAYLLAILLPLAGRLWNGGMQRT